MCPAPFNTVIMQPLHALPQGLSMESLARFERWLDMIESFPKKTPVYLPIHFWHFQEHLQFKERLVGRNLVYVDLKTI